MDKLTEKHRSWNMSRIQGKNTRPEIAMRSLLHRNGFRFRLHEKKLPGKPDIILPKYKTVIFVHGCFWHRHENCKYCYVPKSRNEFWDSKFRRTIQRDVEQMKTLSEDGWFPMIIWECEIKENPTRLLEKVQEMLQGQILKIKGGI